MQGELHKGQTHSRTDLQKSPYPAIWQINFFLLEVVTHVCAYFKATWINYKLSAFVIADFLEFLIQLMRVINIGGAISMFTNLVEHFIVATELAITGFILRKAFKKQTIRMHSNHRVEYKPSINIVFIQILEIICTRLIIRC